MGTTTPAYSARLAEDIAAAGGRYVEAPVSGSRKPAQDAQLIAMTAGDEDAVRAVEPALLAMCKQSHFCGAVPSALQMKLAVNLYLITTVAGLTEAFHLARHGGLDLETFKAILDNGPMSSPVSRVKLDKLVAGDFAVQASIADVLKNCRLIASEARRLRAASPLLDTSLALFARTLELDFGGLDMVGMIKALEEKTAERGFA
jgi:3-hydroxyisobutyrate dehydrogenase